MADRTVLVLGCGVAGLAAVRELRRLMPEERIIVIERAAAAAYPPSFPALAAGEVRPASIRRWWGPLARRGIELVNAPVQSIDLEGRQVRAESRLVRYDQLIVALGAEPAPEVLPGLAEAAQSFATTEGAERLAAALRYFSGGRVLIALPDAPTRWPPAAYELAMLMEHYFHLRKMRQRVEISVFSPDPVPLASLGVEVSDLIAGQLAHKGIEFAGGMAMASVDQLRRTIHFGDGSERAFDLLIAATPLKSPQVTVDAGLAEAGGWLRVDRATMETAQEGVYAAGNIVEPQSRSGLSWSGTLAAGEGRLAAREVARKLGASTGAPARFGTRGRFFVEVGAGAAIMISGDLRGRAELLSVTQPSIVWHWAKGLFEKRWRYERW